MLLSKIMLDPRTLESHRDEIITSCKRRRVEVDIDAAIAAQQRVAEAQSRFVPHQFLEILNRSRIVDVQLGDSTRREVSVLFCDIRKFTTLVEAMTNSSWAKTGTTFRSNPTVMPTKKTKRVCTRI